MARVALNHREQISLLHKLQQRLQLPKVEMAKLCRVHRRTFADWWRGKYRMRHESLQILSAEAGLTLERSIQSALEYEHTGRAGRLGALRKYALYGNPGTPEGRRKGGLITGEQFRKNPELARARGFQIRKVVKYARKSALLAEFIGIMLGDGSLGSPFQARISFNSETDAAYGIYLKRLFRRLFSISATVSYRPGTCDGRVTASSRALVEYLERLGLVRGNKVSHQVELPRWIWHKCTYQRAALRGLMDTDGSIYHYSHEVYGHRYTHLALCFTNRSKPLLIATKQLLTAEGFSPRTRPYQVYLNRHTEIQRYFNIVGSRNQKHLSRFRQALRLKRIRGLGQERYPSG